MTRTVATVRPVRIALVRGPNLNAWELANFDLPGFDVVTFGSRLGSFEAHGLPMKARRLPSPVDGVRRLPSLVQAGVLRATGSLDYLVGLERALRGFDIAHVADLATPYSLQAVRARDRGACRRVVATVWENIAVPAVENGHVQRRMRAVAAGVDRFLAISERARLHLHLADVPASRVEVLPMGVDLDRFRPTSKAEQASNERLRVLSVCRLVPEKGVEDLVVATRLLTDRGVDAHLTLAGQGPLLGRLQAVARELGVGDRVTFAGVVHHEQLPHLHHEHDVFVLASAPRTTWQEQFGFAVVEAMASGLSVLAGHSGSLDEVVGDSDQLIVPHDPGALAEALAALAANPARRQALGERNRRRAEERFDRRRIASRIGAFYERALEAPVPARATSARSSRSPSAAQS
jgi:phosphatidylinositol alpha-1,6-mannosyltransferase